MLNEDILELFFNLYGILKNAASNENMRKKFLEPKIL